MAESALRDLVEGAGTRGDVVVHDQAPFLPWASSRGRAGNCVMTAAASKVRTLSSTVLLNFRLKRFHDISAVCGKTFKQPIGARSVHQGRQELRGGRHPSGRPPTPHGYRVYTRCTRIRIDESHAQLLEDRRTLQAVENALRDLASTPTRRGGHFLEQIAPLIAQVRAMPAGAAELEGYLRERG